MANLKGCGRKVGPYDCCTVVCGDCLELMKALPDGCVDAVITDPPYNYGKDYGTHDDAMDWQRFCDWLTVRFSEAARLLAEGGSVYFTCSTQMMGFCASWPFIRFRQWLIWHRPNLVNVHAHSDWKQTWEPIYYGGKGTFRATKGVFPDSAVFTIATPQSNFAEGRFHVCQRPVELIEAWLSRCEAETILDPFLGSGTTAVAAKKLGRHFLGFEIEQKYMDIAEERIALVEAQPNLFEKKAEQLDLVVAGGS